MLTAKSFLALDFGAVTLKMAGFEPNEAGGLRLTHYAFRSLGPEGLQESTREAALQRVLGELLAEAGAGSRQVNVCAPGFHVFSKFVKLPPVDTSKVTQIIQYEAQQIVPFPLEEVVWDYQILGAAPSGELEVLLVAIKSEIVEGLFRTTETAGLKLGLVDVSPAALANAFRYNYGDLEGCTMLLDIGAKTSNLLFFDKDNVYARGINIGAHSITADFAKETKLSVDSAEELKITQGFVSLGGAYEEPEDPHQQAISKIARQVMTRLHIQVNQTIQFYRGQQGGAAPVRLFLSGGASSMPYTAQFFAEKLNLPVEYFNPLRNVQIDPALNLEELAKVGHQMGELVGLGLRNLAHCPVELNLMPKSSQQRQEFGARKPYFIATMACLVAIVFAWGYFYNSIAAVKERSLGNIMSQIEPQKREQTRMDKELRQLKVVQARSARLADWMGERGRWARLLSELRQVFIETERTAKQQFGVETGVWIEQFAPKCDAPERAVSAVHIPGLTPETPQATRRGARGRGGAGAAAEPLPCTGLILHCRAVDLTQTTGKPELNTTFAFLLASQLQTNALFVSTNTGLQGQLVPEGETFTFQVQVTLKEPLEQ